jgi:hypothetical protein
LAAISVSDVFILQVRYGWQAFIELADGQEHWALAARPTQGEAEQGARHFLETLAVALSQSSQDREAALPSTMVAAERAREAPDVESALNEARSQRERSGWELVFSRQREYR